MTDEYRAQLNALSVLDDARRAHDEAACRKRDAFYDLRAAIKAAQATGVPITQIAEAAGISRQTVYKVLEEDSE